MEATRKLAIAAGVLYLITHVTSVPAVLLYAPVLNDPDYIIGPGADAQVLVGALLEVVLALAIVGTGVALFPVVKRQHEGIALGYVGLRILEAAIIAIGIVSLLSIVALRRDLAGASDAEAVALVAVGRSLVASHDWTFLVGPNFVLGTSTALLAYLLYRSGFVPRPIAILGLVGGPVILASATAVLFGLYEQVSFVAGIVALPVFAWEVSLAIWLIVKGFRFASRGA